MPMTVLRLLLDLFLCVASKEAKLDCSCKSSFVQLPVETKQYSED